MSIHDQAWRGFQHGAGAYERGRPGYPSEAIEWIGAQLGLGPGRTVLDVGAGTGKLTRELAGSGASLVAVEPVPAMREVLEQAVPAAQVLDGTAEALPVRDQTVDAIVVGQAFHWFDGPVSVAEFHRVLRPGGRFAVIWNRRLRDQPLHRAISEIIEPYRSGTPSHYGGEWRDPIESGGLFAPAGELEVPYEQQIETDGLVDRVCSTSFIAALSERERGEVLARVRALGDRAEQPLRLGYVTEAYVFERI
jgi:SAM-dependent methyltransferase